MKRREMMLDYNLYDDANIFEDCKEAQVKHIVKEKRLINIIKKVIKRDK